MYEYFLHLSALSKVPTLIKGAFMKTTGLLFFTLILLTHGGVYAAAAGANSKKTILVINFRDRTATHTAGCNDVGMQAAEAIVRQLNTSALSFALQRSYFQNSADEAGASLVVSGVISEFGMADRPLPFASESLLANAPARCVFDLQLLDPTTGRLLKEEKITGEIWPQDLDHDLHARLNAAFKQAVYKSIDVIENQLAAVAWQGQIIHIEEGQPIVNTGSADGHYVGQEFEILRPGAMRLDPASGQARGVQKTAIGHLRLSAILGPRKARATVLDDAHPQVGDLIQ